MSTTLDEQINQLKRTIADIESQRSILGDAAVNASLVPFQEKLTELEAQTEPPKEPPSEIPTRQRKLVTLLYMDVVGSTAMTQHLDPEDTLEIMDNALPRLAAPIEKHGGHVTRYTGDGFKAVFGDPVAREDDPEKAIQAGLEILDVATSLAQEIESEWDIEDFQVRIGIDTGLAALGGQTEAEDTVMGRVVNLAIRIESAAPSGGLLISHNTYRHVRGIFNVEPQEPITAKGFPEPVPVYLVKEIKPRAFRVQTRGVEGVETRMVGRNDELRFLQDALVTVFEEGEGHVVTVSGEAGVGKSRLLYEFDNWIELLPTSQSVRFFQGRGSQEAQGLPYSLLRDMFSFRFQVLDGDQGKQVRQKVESGFCEVFGGDDNGVMRAHILGQLLGFNFSASSHLKGVINDAEQLRNRGLMYLIQYFQTLSQEIPVVTLLEDIHWADDSSLDFVNRIGEYTPQLPILLVCAARPILYERRPYWGEGQTYHTRMELRPLSKRESRQLVTEILKLAAIIPTELRELIVRGAEGNPFYTEELIKMLIEDSVVIPDEETWQIDLTRLEEVDVPSTLAGVIQARLDNLPPQERTVLQQASVVGRLFWDRIVAYIQAEEGNGADPLHISQSLTSLRNRELVYRHEESEFVGAVEYLFKHDVLREVTYESVLKRLRKIYHGLVADWLIVNSGDRINEYNGLIAEHLLLASRKDQACQYFNLAGEAALAGYASFEAEYYYRQALDLSISDFSRPDVLMGLGEALYRQGKIDDASDYWQLAIDSYQEFGNRDRMAEVYARLSSAIWDRGYLTAWNVCQEGLDKMIEASDSPGYARLLAESGRVAHFRSDSIRAGQLCQRAIEMGDRLGNFEVITEAKITLAMGEEDPQNTIDIMKEVVSLAEAKGLQRTVARAHNNIGSFLEGDLIDLEAALIYETRSLEIYKEIGDTEMMLFVLSNVFVTSTYLGESDNLMDRIARFLSNSPASDTQIEHEINKYARGQLRLRAEGKGFEAIELLRERVEKNRQRGSIQPLAVHNLFLAETILDLNRFGYLDDLAEAEQSLKENINIEWMVLGSQFLLSVVNSRRGLIPEAKEWIATAESRFRHQESNIFMAYHSLALFELAQAESHWDEAIEACRTSIEIYKNCHYRLGWAHKLIDLGDALAGRNEPGDLERARETYQQSLDMFTEMGAPGYIKVLEERLGILSNVPSQPIYHQLACHLVITKSEFFQYQ